MSMTRNVVIIASLAGDNDSDNRSQSEDPDSSNNKTHSATVKRLVTWKFEHDS